MTTIDERRQGLTPTNVAGVLHTTWPKAYKSPEWHQQIWPTRPRFWQSISQLQTAIQWHHRPPIFMVLTGRQCQGRRSMPQWAKYPNLSDRSFVTSKKPILGFYFITKTVHIYVAFSLMLITFWACTLNLLLPHLPGARWGRQGMATMRASKE
jgi:hypothetical protein